MTKVEAIKKVLEDNKGIATWNIIYNQLEKYYPEIKNSKDWKAGVRGVLYRDIGKNFKMIDEGVIALLDYNENNLALAEDIADTTKSFLIKIRTRQQEFRKKLLKHLKFCPITNIDEEKILVASHIKPWAMSSDKERVDIYNGFIFSPTIDKIFDKGLITFENNKRLIISDSLSKLNIKNIGIENGKRYFSLPIEGRYDYLDYHRNNIFISTL